MVIQKKAIVLLSGGLDSATVLYFAKEKGYRCENLLFDYGQRHKKELIAAKKISEVAGCKYRVVKIAFPWGGSSLLKYSETYPKDIEKRKLPSTYVPGRNTIFISYALSYAEVCGASDIFIGANAIDFSGYPDCRPQYYYAWNKLISSLGIQIRVQAPLINKTKAQIIRLGLKLKVPYELTWSCYKGASRPCGVCNSCKIRAKGFLEAGVIDPALDSIYSKK